MKDAVLGLSGDKRVKIVWSQNWDPAQTFGEYQDVYGGANIFKLVGYDTADDTIRVILGQLDDYSQPTLTSDGERIVYSDRVENKIFVVNWNGQNRRLVRGGAGRRLASTTWRDPASGIEWVYFVEGDQAHGWGDFFAGAVRRVNLDPPGQVELVWNQTLATHYLAISADGTRLSGGFPWPDSGLIVPRYDGSGGGEIFHPPTGSYSIGCWPTITPDNRYILGIFNGYDGLGYGPHRGWKVWDCPSCPRRQLDLFRVAGNEEGWEVCHPRMSNSPRLVTVTGPYSNGVMGEANMSRGGPRD